MPIPQYQEFMNPALEAFADKKIKGIREVEKDVISVLKLSNEDITQLLPSETQTIVSNRVNWAVYYMYRAGLLERAKRGYYKITPIGLKTINDKIKINNEYLNKFESFRKFQEKSITEITDIENDNENFQEQDPITKINTAINAVNQKVQTELLEQLKKVDPIYFEQIILDLMLAMGYGGHSQENASLTPKSHDGGIDGIINEDKLGLDKIYLQAKRYNDTKVNSKEMQNFLGGLTRLRAKKGVFITTGEFDVKAEEMAKGSDIVTINGERLTELMLKHNVGVITRTKIEIKELDLSYFNEE